MSRPQPHHGVETSPTRHTLYPYRPETGERQSIQLPPMASLLAGNEQHHQGTEQSPYQYSRQPPSTHLNHPLHFSQMNPSAPVHHMYHPPQASHHQQPVLVPLPGPPPPLSPIVPYQPGQGQIRQAKKISQRREDFLEASKEINRFSAPQEPQYVRSPVGESQHGHERRQIDQRAAPVAQGTSSPPITSPTESMQAQPSLPASNMLSETPKSKLIFPKTKYNLIVRQQPESARACGFGERDRRVVDPPPILVLDIDGPNIETETYVVHCTLWNPEMDEDDSAMPVSTERKQQRRLMGTNIASPFYGQDENKVDRCFFTFPDLSVRTPGIYSLRFTLVVMDYTKMHTVGFKAPVTAMVKCKPFQVFNAKDFRGMRASTALTKSLKAQGCLIPVKKGNTRANTGRSNNDEDDEEGNDDDGDERDEEEDGPPGRGKRAKR